MRFAINALQNTGKFLLNNMGQGPGEIAFRVVPDIGFGLLAATQTPGDLTDKLIAGGSQAAGGILGGVGTVGALRKIKALDKLEGKESLLNLADMAGSVAGDFAGMAVGDNLSRGKDLLMGGSGQTAWERMGAQEQAIFAEQLKQQLLAQYGIVPGTREQYASDPSTGMGVS
ncbi:MAG: hypothetical protein ACO20I_13500 [bacterium]|jgi:hypothetical protein